MCDDQHDMGPAFVYLKWVSELWSSLKKMFDINENDINQDFIFKWNVNEIMNANDDINTNIKGLLSPENTEIYEMKLEVSSFSFIFF